MDVANQTYKPTSVSSDANGFFSTFEVLIQNIIRENNIKRCLIERKILQAQALEKDSADKQERITAVQKEIPIKNRNIQQLEQSVALRQSNLERLREHVNLLEEHESSLKRQISLKTAEANHRSDTLNGLVKRAAKMKEEYKAKYKSSTLTTLVSKLKQTDISGHLQMPSHRDDGNLTDQSISKVEPTEMEIAAENGDQRRNSAELETTQLKDAVAHPCSNHIRNSPAAVIPTQKLEKTIPDEPHLTQPSHSIKQTPNVEQYWSENQRQMKSPISTNKTAWLSDKSKNVTDTDAFPRSIQTQPNIVNSMRFVSETTPSIPQLDQTSRTDVDKPLIEQCAPAMQVTVEIPHCSSMETNLGDMVSSFSTIGTESKNKPISTDRGNASAMLPPFTSTPFLSQPPLKSALFKLNSDEPIEYTQNVPSDCVAEEPPSSSMVIDKDETMLPVTMPISHEPQMNDVISQKIPVRNQNEVLDKFSIPNHHVKETYLANQTGKKLTQSIADAAPQYTSTPKFLPLDAVLESSHDGRLADDEPVAGDKREPKQNFPSKNNKTAIVNTSPPQQSKLVPENTAEGNLGVDRSPTHAEADNSTLNKKTAEAQEDEVPFFREETDNTSNAESGVERPHHGFDFEDLFNNGEKEGMSAADLGGFWVEESSPAGRKTEDTAFTYGNLFGKDNADDEEQDEDGTTFCFGTFLASNRDNDESTSQDDVSFWNGGADEDNAGKNQNDFFGLFNAKGDQGESSNDNGLLF